MLVACDGAGKICGYLRLVLVSGRLFGRFLISLSYLNRAGVVAPCPRIAAALISEEVALASRLDVRYLELRHGEPVEHADLPESRGDKSRMVLELGPSSEGLWQSIGPKVRNQVRKGEKHNLTVRWGKREMVDEFYNVFSVNMRDLGTPVYPRKLFEQILMHFAQEALVDLQGRPVAAALLIHAHGSTHVPSASSLRQYHSTNANMWMYHRLLLRAIERGSRQFDFGRSSVGSGTYRFKKQWGAQPRPTVW